MENNKSIEGKYSLIIKGNIDNDDDRTRWVTLMIGDRVFISESETDALEYGIKHFGKDRCKVIHIYEYIGNDRSGYDLL
jgi:hypothetical protein